MSSSDASADRKLMFMDHCRNLMEGNLVVKVTRTWDPTPVRNGVATTHSAVSDLTLYRLSTPNNIDTLADSHAGVCYIIHKDHHSDMRASVIRSVSAHPEV
ncbi:hypothetical protein AAVH_22605 [Aphelenchoides avenae]|nr:hypothetical protein AAVH_22605 [Aphelenchus avenae]